MAPSDIRPARTEPTPAPRETAVDAATGHSAGEIADAVSAARRGKKTAIWDALKRTDPKATKPFQRSGGFRGTQIDPVWRIQMMTEVFGPVGMGWGYEQLEWTIAERMVFICCRVWYIDPETGEKFFTGPQWGGTELVSINKDRRERPDDEAFKKSMTDALGKCLLTVGLAADVHLGQFDDSKYREEAETFYAAKEAGWTELERKRFEKNIVAKLNDAADLDALNDLWEAEAKEDVHEIAQYDKACRDRIVAAFKARKSDIRWAVLEKAVAEAADLDALNDLWRPNKDDIAGLKDADPARHGKVAAAFKARKDELAADRDADAGPLPERPAVIAVPQADDGEFAWGMWVDQVLATVARVPSRPWGEAFLSRHKAQVAELAKVRDAIGTLDGKPLTGITAASRIRGALANRLDEIDPPGAPAAAAE